MTIRGFKGLQNAIRRVRARFAHGALILLYHRIAETSSDPFSLTVHPRAFAEHLEVIRRSYRPLRLCDLTAAMAAGAVPRGAVVITFDDGYANNLLAARPMLERNEVPATVFVTSGLIGREEPWWDRLVRLVLSESVPLAGSHSINGEEFEWQFADRERLLRGLHSRLRPLAEQRREPILDRLAAGSVSRNLPAAHPMLSQEQLRRLADGDLVEIGAHTVTHPVLSSLTPVHRLHEIAQSRTDLEALVGREVQSFSYPYGLPADVGATTVRLVREAGYKVGCTAVADLVRQQTNPLTLPRIWINDANGDRFAKQLRGWVPFLSFA